MVSRHQILICRCVTIEAQIANFAQICRDRRPRRSKNKGRLLSKCRASVPREIYPFVLGPSGTPVPTGLWVIFCEVPLSKHIDKSQFESLSNHSTLISPKDKWAHPKKRSPLTVFAFGKYWARPLRHGRSMFAPTPLGHQKTFPKRFLRSFFIKKATLGAAAPRTC